MPNNECENRENWNLWLLSERAPILYALLSKAKFSYPLKMNVDDWGSFTEFVHTQDCGQVFINSSELGSTKE